MSDPSDRLISINQRSSSKMNASLITTNTNGSSSLLQIHPSISFVNESLHQLILPPANYCSFPAQHNHILSRLRNKNPLADYVDSIESDNEINFPSSLAESSFKSMMISEINGTSSSNEQKQLLDPYIDAVRVKNRVNNKRGERVKAMPSPSSSDFKSNQLSSSTKKTYHILSHPGEVHHLKDEWYTSDESESDADDEYGDDDKHKKVVKKVYLQEYPASKVLKSGKLYEHDDHDVHHKGGKYKSLSMGKKKRKKKSGGKKKLGKRKRKQMKKKKKKKKKITYAYIYHSKPIEAYYEEHYEDNSGYKSGGKHSVGGGYSGKGKGSGKGDSYYHKKHHDDHKGSYMAGKGDYYSGKSKTGKYSMSDYEHKKGKFSVAGLLGYTLLCVNYLLLMHHPGSGSGHSKDYHHHDEYHSGGGYSKYSPHAAASHISYSSKMSPFSSGPVILAHCGELPEPKSLVKLHAHASEPKVSVSLPAVNETSKSRPVNKAAQQPPSFYYTPNINQQVANPIASSGSINRDTYIALNRIFLPTDPVFDPAGERVTRLTVRRPRNRFFQREAELESPRRRLRVSLTRGGLIRNPPTRLLLETERGGDGLRVVRTRDNLVEMRRRNVDVRLRVHHRQNGLLVMSPRAQALRAAEPQPVNLLAQLGPIQVAVQAPGYATLDSSRDSDENGNSSLMLADQGISGRSSSGNNNNNNNNNREPSSDANNNEMLDLPEFALAGDSIELTCNHRMPESRLYSVKWFKDSLEFYRFIPANGPRTKSSLFLPDVRLDLARSDSETLYLRNVSHRTSGLYRCEAVSEGPDFETLSGEKRMQVYALPEKGPQLSLLKPEVQQPTVSFTLRPPLEIALSALRGSTQLEQPEESTEMSNESPIVRCISSRSSPASELRLLVNNQLLDVGRAVENSTLSYSDGTQSNVVSFRLRLSDFTYESSSISQQQERNSSSLNKEASLDSFSSSKVSPTQSQSQSGKSDIDLVREEADKDKNTTPNAAVHFDDSSAPMRESDFRGTENQKPQHQHETDAAAAAAHKSSAGQLPFSRTDNSEDSGTEVGVVKANSGTDENEKSDDSRKGAETTNQFLTTNQLSSRVKRQTSATRNSAGRRRNSAGTDEAAGEDDTDKDEDRKREGGGGGVEAGAARRASSGGQLDSLERERERERERETAREQQQQQGQQVYSSFIRIKCTSLVPAVGYEMTSELLAPLTLLVPSRQLTDASLAEVRRSSDKQLASGDSLRRQDGGNMRAIRTGGNSARALVLIDRIAQASAPQASKLLPGALTPSNTSATNSNNSNNNSTTTPSSSLRPTSKQSARSRTVAKSAREKALEERAKYLDELSKQSKSVEVLAL